MIEFPREGEIIYGDQTNQPHVGWDDNKIFWRQLTNGYCKYQNIRSSPKVGIVSRFYIYGSRPPGIKKLFTIEMLYSISKHKVRDKQSGLHFRFVVYLPHLSFISVGKFF